MTASSPFPLIDTNAVAARLGLKPETLEKRRANYPETLPPHYAVFGRTVRYSEPELAAWIEAGMPERRLGEESSPSWLPAPEAAVPHAPLWTTQRLAEALGVTASCLEKRRSSAPSSLPHALKTGRSVRFREAAILAWLARTRTTV